MTKIQIRLVIRLAGGVFCLRRILSVKIIITTYNVIYSVVRPIGITTKGTKSTKQNLVLCFLCLLWLKLTWGYLPLTITFPPPSGTSAVLVPTRRQITPLLSRIVIA